MTPFLRNYGILLALSLIWGSSFILMKKAMAGPGGPTFSSFDVASIRLAAGMLVLLPFAWKVRPWIWMPEMRWILLVGLLGNGIPSFLFTYAQTGLSSSLTAMINALTPLFTLLVAVILFNQRSKAGQIAGVAFGMCGAALLVWGAGQGETNHFLHAMIVVLATICYAFSGNIIRHKLAHLSALDIASLAVFSVGLPSLLWLVWKSPWEVLTRPGSGISLIAACCLGILGTSGALVLWNVLVKKSGAVFASSVTYLIPFVAALWGWLDGELITWRAVISGGLVLTGVAIIGYSGAGAVGK